MQKLCTTKTILDRFPIIAMLRKYKLGFLYDDVVAGITVGLTAIPQSIAYSAIAGIDTKVCLNFIKFNSNALHLNNISLF